MLADALHDVARNPHVVAAVNALARSDLVPEQDLIGGLHISWIQRKYALFIWRLFPCAEGGTCDQEGGNSDFAGRLTFLASQHQAAILQCPE